MWECNIRNVEKLLLYPQRAQKSRKGMGTLAILIEKSHTFMHNQKFFTSCFAWCYELRLTRDIVWTICEHVKKPNKQKPNN